MKQGLTCAFGMIVLGMGGIASNPASAATTAAGPYYANPSWDQQLPASTRFIVLSNWIDAAHPSGGAAVLDRETGLIWEQSPSTATYTWEDAQYHCNDLRVGNRTGWRLPTLQELTSLVDPTVASPGPTLPAGHPFQTSAVLGRNWTATTYAASTNIAWQVVFIDGHPYNDDSKSDHVLVWCVRGGQGADPQ